MMPCSSTVRALAACFATAPVAMAQCPQSRVVSPALWERASFGKFVQISGDVAVVADPADDSFCTTPLCSSGAVHAFRRRAGEWQLEQTIYHSRISPYDGFGSALAMDGPSRIAATSGGDAAIYLFEHDGEAWREVVEIFPAEPGVGAPLVLRGDTLLAGQYKKACWIYRQRNGRWEFDQKLEPPDPLALTWFTHGLALDGEWLAVGAPRDGEITPERGAVFMYRRSGHGQFEFVTKIQGPPGEIRTFGWSVDLEGDRLVVGAPSVDSKAGALFMYEFLGGAWTLTDSVRRDPAVRTELGAAVSMVDDTIVAGAPTELLSDTYGAAYAFERQADATWREVARILPEHRPSAHFGSSVATDGASVIVGAPNETVGGATQTGAAHIFDLGCLLCRADLDGDGQLTFFDFLAFQTLFAAGDLRADFDGDGELTFFDFLAFQNEFAAGCE